LLPAVPFVSPAGGACIHVCFPAAPSVLPTFSKAEVHFRRKRGMIKDIYFSGYFNAFTGTAALKRRLFHAIII
jgi:hypothetical protein